MSTSSHMIASDDRSSHDQTAGRLSMHLASTTAAVPTTDHSVDPSRESDKTLSAALQQLTQLSGQQISTQTQQQVQSTAPGLQLAPLVPSAAEVLYNVESLGCAVGATSTQQSAQQSAQQSVQQQAAPQAALQEPTAPAPLSSWPPGPADGQADGARLTHPTDTPLPRMDLQPGSTQGQQLQQQQDQQQHQGHLQGLLPFPTQILSQSAANHATQVDHDLQELHAAANSSAKAHAQEQMLDMMLAHLTTNSHQALLQLLGPGAQKQQQQGSSLPAAQPVPAALPQQQQQQGKVPGNQLPAESPAIAAAAAAAAADGVYDAPAGGSNSSGRKGSALQQLLAMALDGTQPSSGAIDALPPPPQLSHTQQQQQQQQQQQFGIPGGAYAEVPDMLLQPQAPYTSGRRARSTQQQQQQQQEGPGTAEGDGQQQQQKVKKRRARVMTPSGMGMCQDITPGSIKAVPVALRLTKGSSGEYRLRMPTALILSQFAFAKMPVTLPLEVFVDGKPVATPLAAPRKRQRTALNDPSAPRCDRPLVKIVCDCDRYRLSGLASAGLGRYVGYTVTRVASQDGTSITLFLESPREDRFAGLDMAGYGDSLSMAAAAAATAAGGGQQQYDVALSSDVAHRDVFATLTAAAALTAAGGADMAALAAAAAAAECAGGGGEPMPDCGVLGALNSQGPSAVGVEPGPALLHSLSAQLQDPQHQQQQQQVQADLLTLRVFEDMQQQILQYQAFFQQLGVQPPVRKDKATQWDHADLQLPAAAAAVAAVAAGAGGGGGGVAASAAAAPRGGGGGGGAAACGSSGTALQQQQQQGGVGCAPAPVDTDNMDAEGPNTQQATPAAAAAASGAHAPAGTTAATAVSAGAPVKLETHHDHQQQQQQQQSCSLVANAPAAAAGLASAAAPAVGLASGAGCRPQVQAGVPRVVEADEAADALLMLSR